MASGKIQQRIHPDLQKKAEAVLKVLGIKPSQAITLFYVEITRRGNLPFHPSNVRPSEIPNQKLAKEIREARRGGGVQTFENKEDFFTSLKEL